MSDALKTSPVAPPSIALARMAWFLAWERAFRQKGRIHASREPVHRDELHDIFPASTEYYRIIARLSAGEAP